MQRNSINQSYITLFWISILLLSQLFSSIYPFIPSFVGVVFCYLILNFHQYQDNAASRFLSFFYLCVYDLSKGFWLFSFPILFILVYNFAFYKMQTIFTCNNCILAVYVFIAYLGHFLLNAIFSYTTNQPFPYFSSHYFYLIALDSLLAFLLFRISR